MSSAKAYEIFISYSRADKARVMPWVSKLREGGIEVFFDTESIVSGFWRKKIVSALKSCRMVIFMASPSSFASKFTPRELTLAEEYNKVILPVFLEKVEIPQECAFTLVGMQRIDAHLSTRDEVWTKMWSALAEAGLIWTPPPPPKPPEPQRRLKPDDRFLDLDVDVPEFVGKKIQTGAKFPREGRTRIWARPAVRRPAMMMGLALILFTGSWLTWGNGTPKEVVEKIPVTSPPPPVTNENEDKPVPSAIPVARPETLSETAERLTREYYDSPSKDQLALMARKVRYFDHYNWTRDDVEQYLKTYAKTWPVQSLKIVGPIQITGPNADDSVECQQQLHFEISNDVVRSSGNFKGAITVGIDESQSRIVSVRELPKTRTDDVLEYLEPGQQQCAIAFTRQVVLAGNSDSGVSAEKIGNWFVAENAYYDGNVLTKAEIAKRTAEFQSRWPNRSHQIIKGPEVTGGLGGENVTVNVTMSFDASHGNVRSTGIVESEYEIHFSRDGTPLIQGVRELSRRKLPSIP